jgi:hypothetical protein
MSAILTQDKLLIDNVRFLKNNVNFKKEIIINYFVNFIAITLKQSCIQQEEGSFY